MWCFSNFDQEEYERSCRLKVEELEDIGAAEGDPILGDQGMVDRGMKLVSV